MLLQSSAPPPLPHYDTDMQPPRSLLGDISITSLHGNGGGQLNRCALSFFISVDYLCVAVLAFLFFSLVNLSPTRASAMPPADARPFAVGFMCPFALLR